VKDPRVRSLFTASHIRTRHLDLPPPGPDGPPVEGQGELLARHRAGALDMGGRALTACLARAGLGVEDVDHLCVITTTGFLAPGLSAHLIRALGLREDCSRLDVVGMGCNAGLNGLGPVAAWARAHPGRNAVMLCVEACSAAYVFDGTLRTAIVNSLFGDGAAAILVRADGRDEPAFAPALHGFASHIIPQAIDAMRYDWDEAQGKFSFYLDRDVPYVVGAHAETPVRKLLAAHRLPQRAIAHWVVHSGGKKVVDAIKYNLGLSAWDVRHTSSVLRDFGNLSSGSFLFSLERLHAEGRVRRGDWGVLMTMGPGSTIETALVRW
jgi:polyketide synthase Type III